MGFKNDFEGFFREAKETDVELLTECEAIHICSIILGIRYGMDSISEIVVCAKAPLDDEIQHYIFITSEERKSHPCDIVFYSALLSVGDGLTNFENRFSNAKGYIKRKGFYHELSHPSKRWELLSNLAIMIKDYYIKEG
jgi:hypothetical protein